jgi:hypothetical protein
MRKAPLVLAVLALSAARAAGQTLPHPVPFEHQLAGARQAALPTLDDLLGDLLDARDAERQLEALKELALRSGAFAQEDQLKLVAGVSSAVESDANAPSVRLQALDTLGKTAPSLRDAEAARTVVTVLTEAAHRSGAGLPDDYHVFALLGLSQASGRLPWIDRRSDELVILTALDGLRDARTAREATLSMLALSGYIDARGPGLVLRSPALSQRLKSQLIEPLSAGTAEMYSDARADGEYRYFLIQVLSGLARSKEPSAALDVAPRARAILKAMGESDPEARLRQIARIKAVGA